MTITWNLVVTISYTDSVVEIGVVKDDGGFRFTNDSNGTIDDLAVATSLPALNAFLLTIGYGNSTPAPIPSNLLGYAFRFSAIATGSVNVMGGSSSLANEVISNDFDATLASLNTDSDFVDFMIEISGSSSTEGTRVALLTNPAYVDSVLAGQLQASIESLGFDVLPFTDISDVGFDNAVDGRCHLVIPKLDTPLNIDLSLAARAVISNFVVGGGTLMMFSDNAYAIEVFNGTLAPLVGTNLTIGPLAQSPILITVDAAGTPFDGGPSELSVSGSTGSLDDPFPSGSKAVYRDDGGIGYATVLLVPIAAGNAVMFGEVSLDISWLGVFSRATQLCQ